MPNPNLVSFQRGEFDPTTGIITQTVGCAVDPTAVYLVHGFKETPGMTRILYRINESKSDHIDVVGSPAKVTEALQRTRATEIFPHWR